MWVTQSALSLILLLTILSPAAADTGVPDAGHVRLDARALRLRLNDCCMRTQFRIDVTATASETDQLAGLEGGTLTVTNPGGRSAQIGARRHQLFPRKFKAANAKLQFRAVEDTSNRDDTNVPVGFFAGPGPYRFLLELGSEQYVGEFSFPQPLHMTALQQLNGRLEPARGFSISSQAPLRVETSPQTFGPVYYKRQDMSNFVFQLANMDNSLLGGSYHPPVESPSYTFQVRVGDGSGNTKLLDPSRYIAGHQPFLIRSDSTTTPIEFSPQDFVGHATLLIDFIRTDTAEPDAGFYGPSHAARGWSGQLRVQDRVMYALYIDSEANGFDIAGQATAADAEEE